MGHRRFTHTAEFFETDHCQNPTNSSNERSEVPIGSAAFPANGSFVYPVESVSRTGFYGATQQDTGSREVEHSSLDHRVGDSRAPAFHSGPSYGPFPPFSCVGNLQATPENNTNHLNSRHYNTPIVHNGEGSSGPLKRRGSSFERGSSSRSYDAGSSSNSLEIHRGKRASDHNIYPSGPVGLPHHGEGSSVGGEHPIRNVRRRCRIDLESNTHVPSYSSHFSYQTNSATRQSNDCGRMNATYFNGDANSYSQNNLGISPPAPGRFSSSANIGLRNEMNPYFPQGSTGQVGGYNNYPVSGRGPVSSTQYPHNPHAQVMRGGYGSYSQGAAPSDIIRTSSSQAGLETAVIENRQQFPSETNSSRFSRPFSVRGWRNHRSDARSRIRDRFQSTGVNARHRIRSQALLMDDVSNVYGSRNLFDRYGDMRLDVDNMSYEELLALGERIGSVNTGLSEDVISDCLNIATYASDENQEDASCSICLEEYKNEEENGRLKCGHDYHLGCIKKWLSMKNACPICKAPAIADTSKEE